MSGDLPLVQEVLAYRLSGEERSAPPDALGLEPRLDGRINANADGYREHAFTIRGFVIDTNRASCKERSAAGRLAGIARDAILIFNVEPLKSIEFTSKARVCRKFWTESTIRSFRQTAWPKSS